ncbi:MAG: hypothetical protein H6703_16795 [Myxococcales bacterium]|nr:hypothetical protein [Myxococcales bacterium]MCB9552117.1 hypothetical protein [Myxococcales bacterium]
MRRGLMWLWIAAVAWGCDDEGGRARADLGGEGDGPPPMTDAEVDATVDAEPEPELDAAVDGDAAADAAALDGFVGPDLGIPEPESCNGIDDDQDDSIDEGVSNVCGGCGGIPPEGCQAWRVNLVQDPDGTLIAFRTVGLQAQVRGYSERMIEGATCEVLRLAEAPDPDAHLGAVDIDASQAELDLVPTFDPRLSTFSYDNSPELGRTPLHQGGETVEVRTGGGALVGPFEATVETPPVLGDVDAAELRAFLDAARGEGAGGPITLDWQTTRPTREQAVRFFIGGSKPVFGPSNLYRGIEFYQLSARLRDDGEFTLDAARLAPGVPQSSIWVYALREVVRRLPIGQHAVEIVTGQRFELRESGAAAAPADAVAPFDILEPSPNTPEYVPGEPLTVRWGALPAGEGPLELTLSYRDPLAGEQVQIGCVVDEPASGALVLPAEFTEGLPADDFIQLSLRWELSTFELPAPDRGRLTRAVSMILRLDR